MIFAPNGRRSNAVMPLLAGGIVLLLVSVGGKGAWAAATRLDAVTFAGAPDTLYVPARPVVDALGWPIRWDASGQALYLNNQRVNSPDSLKRLLDGTALIAVGSLRYLGATVSWDAAKGAATVRSGSAAVSVERGDKRVEIDRTKQRLRAWQGDLLVLETPVSTGRPGKRTPAGTYTAGPYKARMHHSRLYHNAPMPYSVQVNGNVIIHGFTSVPDQPASHGCIRLPLDGGNPARWFYQWVNRGTPIEITGRWTG